MTHAPKLAIVSPDEPADAWLPIETRSRWQRLVKAPASLYIRGANSPILRISTALLNTIGDPEHVVIHVNPRRRQIRLSPDLHGTTGRRIYRMQGPHSQRSAITATGIPEALGIRQATAIVRFDAVATEEHITLTMRGEP